VAHPGVQQSGLTSSLVYATPLLQHLARFGLNPALHPAFLWSCESGHYELKHLQSVAANNNFRECQSTFTGRFTTEGNFARERYKILRRRRSVLVTSSGRTSRQQHQQPLHQHQCRRASCFYISGYDTRCYFNVRSKADISQLNLPDLWIYITNCISVFSNFFT